MVLVVSSVKANLGLVEIVDPIPRPDPRNNSRSSIIIPTAAWICIPNTIKQIKVRIIGFHRFSALRFSHVSSASTGSAPWLSVVVFFVFFVFVFLHLWTLDGLGMLDNG